MQLSFSMKFKDGTPTEFIPKIWEGLRLVVLNYSREKDKYLDKYWDKFITTWLTTKNVNPKIHTIRANASGRWCAGQKIHFTIFPRSKKMFRFAPVVSCLSVQKIEIIWKPIPGICAEKLAFVYIDGRLMKDIYMEQLAQNDGFNSLNDFFEWFKEDFTGVIVHWTNFKY